MKARVKYLTPEILELTVVYGKTPTKDEKKAVEERLADYALSNLAKGNRGQIYSAVDQDRVAIVVVSDEDVLPATTVEF